MRHLRVHHIAIPLLALLATLPLLVHGCSCGHDQPFHVQSWLEAAQQFRQGTLYPRWAFSPAWQAGEPRFVFYPPLSWALGAVLTLLFPMNAVPVVFIWIALTGAGFSMHHLVSRFAPAHAALICAGIYLANPYMLFNAFERGAYAELLAATSLPLVLLSALKASPTVVSVALPLSLVWLTNAPAGVMATYLIVLIGSIRIVFAILDARRVNNKTHNAYIGLLVALGGGTILGLVLVSFYLLPAAYERRYVQVAMAIIPNLRYQDNFLFGKTDYAAHNTITASVSVLALILLAACSLLLLTNPRSGAVHAGDPNSPEPYSRRTTVQLGIVVAAIAFLLTPASSFFWEHVPNLKYLQFPWRLLSLLSMVLALALAPLALKLSRSRLVTWAIAAAVVVALSQVGSHLYRQGCDPNDYPAFAAKAFRTQHGVLPTDEYTPNDADNDVQRTDNPAYWLISGDPNQPAPGTIANPNETILNYDEPIPFENTVAARAPSHLDLRLPSPQILVLNLRAFPAWQIFRDGVLLTAREHRDDGLIAVALPSGSSSLDVRWQRSSDQSLGLVITLLGIAVLSILLTRSRKIRS